MPGLEPMLGWALNRTGHLREHMASSTAIRVDFTATDGRMIVNRLTDAE